MDGTILVADDDAAQRRYISAVLSASGYGVATADGGTSAVNQLTGGDRRRVDLAILDLNMPDLDGIAVLKAVREADVSTPILVLTSDGSVNRAVEAMQAGANDFLVKPVGPERLDVSIRNALEISHLTTEVRRLTKRTGNRLSFEDLIAIAKTTRAAITMARRASRSDIPVLIEGESGTGKEVFAQAIHGSSERAGAPFIAVNCGAMPSQLVESILFGHEKGAFTGATSRRTGKFQEASGGTLFLDEVGELPLEAQVKLLRAIQTGEIDPVGGSNPVRVDIRIISATNRDLRQMTADGTFREDLFYRLSVFPLTLPPLRDRTEDLPELARMFLKRFAVAENIPVEGFAPTAMDTILKAHWPGNVRQLENTIHRAVVMSDGSVIRSDDLHGIDNGAAVPRRTGAVSDNGAIGDCACEKDKIDPFLNDEGHSRRLFDIEADAIARAIALYRGRMSETARRLGIGRSTLYRKIDEMQLDKREL